MASTILPTINYPSGFSNWLDLALNYSDENKELAICGKLALEYCAKTNSKYIPNIVLAGTHKPSNLPFLNERYENEKTLFYLCQNKTCLLPSTDFQQIINDLTN